MISYSEALHILLTERSMELPSETVPLVLSLGRYLASAIIPGENIPPQANSAMDGYALRAGDTEGAGEEHPVRLKIIGEAPAGGPFEGEVGPGDAVRIMTGGIIPEGADAVVEVESTEEEGNTVLVRRTVKPGTSIRPAGEDVRVGEEIIPAGKRLEPGDIGLLASLGVVNVPVRVKPKVGILATGNEIVEPHRTPEPGRLRNSSGPALYAACVAAGAEPIDLGIAGDDRDELLDALETGLQYDILLTTGGVSAGRYDLVQHLLPEMGVDVRFHKVRIKPGKPILFGVRSEEERKTLVFGLPGNPVSSLVTFLIFVKPVLEVMLAGTYRPEHITARLEGNILKEDDKRHFIRGILRYEGGEPRVSKTGTQSSGAMSSMSRANCLILLDEGREEIDSGKQVKVQLL